MNQLSVKMALCLYCYFRFCSRRFESTPENWWSSFYFSFDSRQAVSFSTFTLMIPRYSVGVTDVGDRFLLASIAVDSSTHAAPTSTVQRRFCISHSINLGAAAGSLIQVSLYVHLLLQLHAILKHFWEVYIRAAPFHLAVSKTFWSFKTTNKT